MKRLISHSLKPALTALLVVVSLVIAACSPTASAQTSGNTPAPATGGETVKIATNSQLGQILVAPDGKTLYTNTVDTPDHLRCVDVTCTGFWKPYTISAAPTGASQIQSSLGTVTRPDGSKQVTYKQQPLYTFYLDAQPGDARGNGFTDFGGTWHVVTLGKAPAGTGGGSKSGSGNSSDGYNY